MLQGFYPPDFAACNAIRLSKNPVSSWVLMSHQLQSSLDDQHCFKSHIQKSLTSGRNRDPLSKDEHNIVNLRKAEMNKCRNTQIYLLTSYER